MPDSSPVSLRERANDFLVHDEACSSFRDDGHGACDCIVAEIRAKLAAPSPVGGELDDETIERVWEREAFAVYQQDSARPGELIRPPLVMLRAFLAALPSRVGDGDAREAGDDPSSPVSSGGEGDAAPPAIVRAPGEPPRIVPASVEESPSCPRCGAAMLLESNETGDYDGTPQVSWWTCGDCGHDEPPRPDGEKGSALDLMRLARRRLSGEPAALNYLAEAIRCLEDPREGRDAPAREVEWRAICWDEGRGERDLCGECDLTPSSFEDALALIRREMERPVDPPDHYAVVRTEVFEVVDYEETRPVPVRGETDA